MSVEADFKSQRVESKTPFRLLRWSSDVGMKGIWVIRPDDPIHKGAAVSFFVAGVSIFTRSEVVISPTKMNKFEIGYKKMLFHWKLIIVRIEPVLLKRSMKLNWKRFQSMIGIGLHTVICLGKIE